jgi:hypothetical protein
MTKPITIPPTAVKLLNDLRKAGAETIELHWHSEGEMSTDSYCRVTIWGPKQLWQEHVSDAGVGRTALLAIQDAIRQAKERGKMPCPSR